jgi:hypothetical protein
MCQRSIATTRQRENFLGLMAEAKALSLRLFKCRMWLWLVVPGLHDAEPTKLVLHNDLDADLTPQPPH